MENRSWQIGMACSYVSLRKLLHLPIRAGVAVALVFFCALVYSQVTELPPLKEPQSKAAAARDKKATTANEKNQQPTQSTSRSRRESGSVGEEMSEISSADRVLIEKACNLKQYSGPAAYRACQREQVAAARESAKVSFDGVSQPDRVLIKKACNLKQYSGPAAYRDCQRHQVSQLNSSQTSRSAGRQ